ncbi:MAG TPA: threonine--tRNA ligase [Thermoleophilia bacterium]|nr:threonine--tRNA ligase [Thermoleophilia bacterium]HQG54883.1 threonine--tRNA ligase [Thermoleophilia bacterium]
MTLRVTLPDGSPLELDDGATVYDAAAAIGPRLARAAIAGRVTRGADGSGGAGSGGAGGDAAPRAASPPAPPAASPPAPPEPRLVDLTAPLHDGDSVAIVTLKADDPDALAILRHTAAHVMAQAVLRLWPGTKYSIGPAIENGFYYDFQLPEPISEADLARIEDEMARIVAEDHPIVRAELPVDEALAMFGKGGGPAGAASPAPSASDQPFKVELIEDLVAAAEAAGEPVPTISVYTQGEFTDLCRGPHLPSTGRLGKGAFKLTSIAGAYWRGDERNAMLTRIYGTAFPTKEALAAHLEALEMARQRDHRRIGRDLDLFSFHDEGPGFPFFHPKGMRIWNAMIDYWRAEHVRAGYDEVRTPQILRRELWERSGHWENYKDNMYFTEIDGNPYAVKPMNCPGGLLVYKSRRRSYRDLPMRVAELGQVHRHEMSGVLHGLFRVRYFTQDDAHIYCTPDQLEDEVLGVVRLMHLIYAAFGFTDVHIELSTRPEKSIGSDEMWARAEGVLARVLEREGIDYKLNPGDGAFYGPKIDFHIRDVMGRTWQCGTIQVDFAMPERLDISYTGADNEEHRPVMIHRALLGSIERFMGILLEHYGGNLPTWLAPVQVLVLPIADRHAAYAREVEAAFAAAEADGRARTPVWVEVDDSSESLGKRIREGQVQKVPYILVVGDREQRERTVSVRERGADKGAAPLERVVADILDEISERRLPAA